MITTHVLDTAKGRPAAGVAVVLEIRRASGWTFIGRGVTDAHGRLADLMGEVALSPGTYRLTFDTGPYLQLNHKAAFYPTVPIVFEIRDADGHYHVPLLVSPYGFSTYRGS